FGSNKQEDRDPPNSEQDFYWQSTPMNYLEKIFQLPFALRPIDSLGFERLVDAFATPTRKVTKRVDSPAPHLEARSLLVKEPPDQPSSLPGSQSQSGPARIVMTSERLIG